MRMRPVDTLRCRHQQRADRPINHGVDRSRDIGHGRQLRMIECVDAPIDVIGSAVTHEAAPDRVGDTGMPGDVGGDRLTQQVRSDTKAQIARTKPFRADRTGETLTECQLTSLVSRT